jgi:hypothetical protein
VSLVLDFHITHDRFGSSADPSLNGHLHYPNDVPKRILFFKPMSWMGQIRTHRRDESWSAGLWQTFFAMTMGAQIPVIAEKPLAACGCRKFQVNPLDDHQCTCTAHADAKKVHD